MIQQTENLDFTTLAAMGEQVDRLVLTSRLSHDSCQTTCRVGRAISLNPHRLAVSGLASEWKGGALHRRSYAQKDDQRSGSL